MNFQKLKEFYKLCHYNEERSVQDQNFHQKLPLKLHVPRKLTSSGQKLVECVVLTFPRVPSKRSPQTTLVAWENCPSHYCAAAVAKSAYCSSVIVQSLLLSETSGDMRHSTDVRRTHACTVLSSWCLLWSKHFHIPKATSKFSQSALLYFVA